MRFVTVYILIVANVFFISSCRSTGSKETPVAILIDTVPLVDTIKMAVVPATAVAVPLTLIITNLASATGPVVIGVYGKKNKFPDPKDQLKEYKFTPHAKELSAAITDLPLGTYAMAIYQDVNSNGKIDKNLIGIPTEPYAFSKNYKPTVKAPAFRDCSFNYMAKNDTIKMKMIR